MKSLTYAVVLDLKRTKSEKLEQIFATSTRAGEKNRLKKTIVIFLNKHYVAVKMVYWQVNNTYIFYKCRVLHGVLINYSCILTKLHHLM